VVILLIGIARAILSPYWSEIQFPRRVMNERANFSKLRVFEGGAIFKVGNGAQRR
jgi:hypothetical protein